MADIARVEAEVKEERNPNDKRLSSFLGTSSVPSSSARVAADITSPAPRQDTNQYHGLIYRHFERLRNVTPSGQPQEFTIFMWKIQLRTVPPYFAGIWSSSMKSRKRAMLSSGLIISIFFTVRTSSHPFMMFQVVVTNHGIYHEHFTESFWVTHYRW